jgi:hypothetical protein
MWILEALVETDGAAAVAYADGHGRHWPAMAAGMENVIDFDSALVAAAAEAVTDFGDLQRLQDGEAVFEIAHHGWSPVALVKAGVKGEKPRIRRSAAPVFR